MTNDVTKAPAWAAKLNDQEWLFVEAYLSCLICAMFAITSSVAVIR
jgi:hypothetical protein